MCPMKSRRIVTAAKDHDASDRVIDRSSPRRKKSERNSEVTPPVIRSLNSVNPLQAAEERTSLEVRVAVAF